MADRATTADLVTRCRAWPYARLHNGFTEREKIACGILRGIPLTIPSFLWPERRQWLLAMEQEYRDAGHTILARFCREEIARHDATMATEAPTGGCVGGPDPRARHTDTDGLYCGRDAMTWRTHEPAGNR